MEKDSKGIATTLIDGIRQKFNGDTTPATIEMISEVWIELLLLHDIAGDLTKLLSAAYSDEQKQKSFIELAEGLQQSISQIANNLNNLPAKSASRDDEQ